MPLRVSSLSDHWLGALIPGPYYQRRFSGDLLVKAKFSPIHQECHCWPSDLFQVLSCFSLDVGSGWVIDLHHPLRSCRAVVLSCQTLIQHPLEQGGLALEWLLTLPVQWLIWAFSLISEGALATYIPALIVLPGLEILRIYQFLVSHSPRSRGGFL